MESVAMSPNFWSGKRVFLTGHTGFKGSWLALWLHQLGAHVTGYALAPKTQPNLFGLAGVADDMNSCLGDVRDHVLLTSAILSAQPEIVIHMAAQALVRYGYQNPVETYATNVMGTVNLMEAARACPSVRVVLSVTSDKCYGNKEWVWGYREHEALGGYDPYSSSKAAAELVTGAYCSSFLEARGVAVASARAGNVIGGGDWAADRLVPDVLSAFAQGRAAHIRNPNAVRPWQHVLEPLSGYLSLCEHLYRKPLDFAGAWNFGPREEDAQPVRWVVEQLAATWGEGTAWELDTREQPHEAHCLKLDVSKAYAKLHWRPQWALEQALGQTVQWYRHHSKGGDMRSLTLEQIAAYQSSMAAAPH
jgi:CDP-glucose 4,6-dehydratase